jgi:hypothetical protein
LLEVNYHVVKGAFPSFQAREDGRGIGAGELHSTPLPNQVVVKHAHRDHLVELFRFRLQTLTLFRQEIPPRGDVLELENQVAFETNDSRNFLFLAVHPTQLIEVRALLLNRCTNAP